MIYSEGLEQQHLALATSSDLVRWVDRGRLELLAPGGAAAAHRLASGAAALQRWMAGRYGAPHVWRDPASGCFTMALMGEYEVASHRSAVGLLTSADGERWELLPERTEARSRGGGAFHRRHGRKDVLLVTSTSRPAWSFVSCRPLESALRSAYWSAKILKRRPKGFSVLRKEPVQARRVPPCAREEVRARRPALARRGPPLQREQVE